MMLDNNMTIREECHENSERVVPFTLSSSELSVFLYMTAANDLLRKPAEMRGNSVLPRSQLGKLVFILGFVKKVFSHVSPWAQINTIGSFTVSKRNRGVAKPRSRR